MEGTGRRDGDETRGRREVLGGTREREYECDVSEKGKITSANGINRS